MQRIYIEPRVLSPVIYQFYAMFILRIEWQDPVLRMFLCFW